MASQKLKMTKRKKIYIVAGSVVLVTLITGGVYLYSTSQDKEASVEPAVTSAAQKELKKLNRSGDQDLATQFIAYVKLKDTANAKKVYEDKIASTSDLSEKVNLLQQYVRLCLDYDMNETALASSMKLVDLQPTHTNYGAMARVYGEMNDITSQISSYQRALDLAKAAKDDVNAQAAVAGYQANIDILKSKGQIR